VVEELNLGLMRTNPESSRVEDLNQRPPNFNPNVKCKMAGGRPVGYIQA